MRPTVDKLCKGINNVLINDILPELSSSPVAQRRVLMISASLNRIATIWEKTAQFPLIEENKDLRDILLAATTTFKATKKDYTDKTLEGLTQEIDAELQREYPSEERYPSVHSLLEENSNLKELLVRTITALDETSRNYRSQALDELRKKIRAHLRKQLNWELTFLELFRQT